MRCKRADKNKSKTFFLDFKTTINLKFEFRSCKKRFTTNSMFNYATLGAALNTITASISFLLFVFCLSVYFSDSFSACSSASLYVSLFLSSFFSSSIPFYHSECIFAASVTFCLSISFSHPPFAVFRILSVRTNEHPRVFHRMPNTNFAIAHFASSINMSTIRFSVIWVHFF